LSALHVQATSVYIYVVAPELDHVVIKSHKLIQEILFSFRFKLQLNDISAQVSAKSFTAITKFSS
jgi:hypothetical protein